MSKSGLYELRMSGAAKTDKKTLLVNAIWNGCGFAATVVITFIMCPILVRGLGDERYGIWALCEATLAFFALLDFGIGASVVRYVAKFEAVKEEEELNSVFSTTLVIFLAAGLAALVGSAILAAFAGGFLSVPSELVTKTRWVLMLLGTSVAMELVFGVYGSVLFALGRFPAIESTKIATRVVGASLFVVVLATGGGLIGLASVVLAMTAAKSLLRVIIARRYLPHLRFSPSLVTLATFHRIKSFSLQAFLILISSRISVASGPIIIGAFLAPQFITYFAIAERLIQHTRNGLHSLYKVLTPAITVRQSRDETNAIRRAFLLGVRAALWIVIPIQLWFLFFGTPFLTLWLGDRLAELSYPVLAILAAPLVISLPQAVGTRVLYGLGDIRLVCWYSVIQALFGMALSVALIPLLGISGVAIGIAVPNTVYLILVVILVCKRLELPYVYYLVRSFLPPLCASPVLLVTWILLIALVPMANWLQLGAVSVVGFGFHFAIAAVYEFRGKLWQVPLQIRQLVTQRST